jgi:TetR/AcrR family transcriptional regulator, cholesterol catabolism regulator
MTKVERVSLVVVKDRQNKILDAAVSLAEEGGFDNVRQRDVAAKAQVALGTLYRRFRSKEDMLVAALDREAEALEKRMLTTPPKGDTPTERVSSFFRMATRGMCRKPKYARAVLRAVASGVPEIAGKIAVYRGRIGGIIVGALRGEDGPDLATEPPSTNEEILADMLQQFWFAALVGWSASLITEKEVAQQTAFAATILIRGIPLED